MLAQQGGDPAASRTVPVGVSPPASGSSNSSSSSRSPAATSTSRHATGQRPERGAQRGLAAPRRGRRLHPGEPPESLPPRRPRPAPRPGRPPRSRCARARRAPACRRRPPPAGRPSARPARPRAPDPLATAAGSPDAVARSGLRGLVAQARLLRLAQRRSIRARRTVSCRPAVSPVYDVRRHHRSSVAVEGRTDSGADCRCRDLPAAASTAPHVSMRTRPSEPAASASSGRGPRPRRAARPSAAGRRRRRGPRTAAGAAARGRVPARRPVRDHLAARPGQRDVGQPQRLAHVLREMQPPCASAYPGPSWPPTSSTRCPSVVQPQRSS